MTDILTELDSMVESGQLHIEKTATNKDSYFVKNLENVASTSHDESIICSSENEEELLENATINQSPSLTKVRTTMTFQIQLI